MQRLLISLALLGASCVNSVNAQSPQFLQWLTVEFEDLRNLPTSADSPAVFHGFGGSPKLYALHNGEAVLYRKGERFPHPPTGPGFEWHRGLVPGILSADPEALVDTFIVGGRNVLGSGNQVWYSRPPLADPGKHRFLSYFIALCPSDDAFIGNEVPIEIFDEDGNFTGPLVIDVYGSDVMDGGQRENNETRLHCLDDNSVAGPFEGVLTDEPVHHHPGYNGSHGNPEATPVRILGATGSYRNENNQLRHYSYQPEHNDFTRPGLLIGRLRVASGPHGGFNGTFYDQTRSGEGVTLEVYGPWNNRQVTLAWYTYLPDGSGDPVYLYGVGTVGGGGGNSDDIVLYRTRGGVFASQQNPTLVESERWGTLKVAFGSCDRIDLIDIRPDDPTWAVPSILNLHRFSPHPTGMEHYCGGFVRGIAPFF